MNRGVVVTQGGHHACVGRWFVGVITATTKRAVQAAAASLQDTWPTEDYRPENAQMTLWRSRR